MAGETRGSDLKRKLSGKGRGERTGAALAARLWDLSETLAISLIFAARVSDLSKGLEQITKSRVSDLK